MSYWRTETAVTAPQDSTMQFLEADRSRGILLTEILRLQIALKAQHLQHCASLTIASLANKFVEIYVRLIATQAGI